MLKSDVANIYEFPEADSNVPMEIEGRSGISGQRNECPTEIDDLDRNVFGLLGLPIDAVGFKDLIGLIDTGKTKARPLLISTPNVNFLVKSQANASFRESILSSNLCLADGMPLIWIGKLLRVPIDERVAGADLFVRLRSKERAARPLKVFLLGGVDGVAAKVRTKLNSERAGLECVGALNPGFGSIEEMSSQTIINAINRSGADLLALFFGAEKAQQWLMHNHGRLRPPIRAQFGATINFEAGTVRRAPNFLRSTGFEWLWRIKEEPYLWRRYRNDGQALIGLLLTSVLPLAIAGRRKTKTSFAIRTFDTASSVTLCFSGSAVAEHVEVAVNHVRAALAQHKQVYIDLEGIDYIDPRFFGLLLMARKVLADRGSKLVFTTVSRRARRLFRLNRFGYLLTSELGD